ncbi:MAG TPA: PAS domain S-box protein [Vicinamibacterales bacterium]|nr:PAS domain S-box protein [Vicinamibacterales bacterium]
MFVSACGDGHNSPVDELTRLRLAVEASGEVVFMTDAAGVITYVNPEFVRVYGYTPEEVVGITTPRLLKGGHVSPADYESFWNELASGHVVHRQFINRTKSGAEVHVECSANPIRANGDCVGFLAVQRDITRRKEVEEALQRSELRYRTLAEAAKDTIFIVNRDGMIEYVNDAAVGLGVRAEDKIGRKLHDVFPQAAADRMWSDLSGVFSTGRPDFVETRFDTPAGDLWLESSLVPMPDDEGAVSAVMGVSRNVTNRKQLERQFLQAQKMEAIGRLAGGIAHDFNNLLTAILGYGELVRQRIADDAELAADVQEITHAGERAARLTRQLLAFSRQQAFAPEALDLNAAVVDLKRLLQRVIGEDIALDIECVAPPTPVIADSGQIEQVIVNLVVNARDAMPQGGRLQISTGVVDLDARTGQLHDVAPGRYATVAIRDSGCGMSPEVLAHVFEPFFTTKPLGKGTGLGLATVYGIVKQCGGFVDVQSATGRGTTVTVHLPAALAGARPRAVVEVPSTPRGQECILLVEDETAVRQLIQRTLEQYGYTVYASRSVDDALTRAERHEGAIDLLLSDVVMPEMSGPDLGQRIVRLRPNIKVLYVSGFPVRVALFSSRIAFLQKPFTPELLATKVRECLDGRS